MPKPRTLLLLRHAPTVWNQAKRLQGLADIPVLPEQLKAVSNLPADWSQQACLSSPLSRCLQTAQALGLQPQTDPRLIEMDWGEFEGRALDDLRAELGPKLQQMEDQGLDFTPSGGESPRQVQARLESLLQDLNTGDIAPVILMTHKGVIRALLGIATGWDFMGRPPAKVIHGAAQMLQLDPTGSLSLIKADLPLDQLPPVADI